MASAFNSSGSTPAFGTPTALNSFTSGLSSTPQSNALNNVASGIAINPSTGNVTTPTPQIPSQPVTSHTVTDAAGNTVKQTYATPESGLLTAQSGSGSAPPPAQSLAPTSSTGQVWNPATNSWVSGAVSTPQSTNNGANAQVGTASGTLPPNSFQETPSPAPVANTAATTPTASGLLSTVAGYGATDPGLTSLYNQQQQLTQQYAGMVGNIQSTPTTLNEQTGRLASIQDEYNTAEANLANTYQANLAQRAQGIGATESALGTATQQVQSPYGTPLFNPATGTVTSGGQNISSGNTGLIGGSNTTSTTAPVGGVQPNDPAYASLQQYAQLVANGTMAASAVPTFGSNPVTLAQLQSMAQQINPSYNPLTTPTNTQAQVSANAAGGATNQTSAIATQQAITRIQNVASSMNNFLTQWGLNQSGSTYINKPMSAFLSSGVSAGAVQSWNLITADLTAATSQLLATPGITPTGFTAELQSFDPSSLDPSELSTYMQSLAVAGQYQLNSYQTTSSSSYGANTPTSGAPITPYVGTPTSSIPPPLPTPTNSAAIQAQNAPSAGAVAGGSLLDLWGGVSGLLSGVAGWAASFL